MSWPTSNKAEFGAPELRRAAIDLLSRRDYSRHELWQKLSIKAADTADLDEVLNDLSERQWQSDARFARVFLSSAQQRGHGPIRIQQAMRQKGLLAADIQSAFEQSDIDWIELAIQVAAKKATTFPVLDRSSQAKLYRFMAGRGFDSEHIRLAIDALVVCE